MPLTTKRRRFYSGGAIGLTLIALLSTSAPSYAAGPPVIGEAWSSQVFSTSARLSAKVNPNGPFTTYHFDYLTNATYLANGETFAGASRIPNPNDANVGSGSSFVSVLQLLSGLVPDTAYRYRVVAHNSAGTTNGEPHSFATFPQPSGADSCANAVAREQSGARGAGLADCRGFELVSPIDKNGGEVAAPGQISGGGLSQAATQGSSVTYGSEASFAGGQGAPPASQYIATRGAGGWSTQNLTVPLFSGSFHAEGGGSPYRLFSPDLTRGVLLNGDRCRGEGSECAVTNPPLQGTDAPAGYQDYYLREGSAFAALLGSQNAGFLTLEPKDFELHLAGTSSDLIHGVLSSCAKLSANATEVPLGEGCDPAKPNLYEYGGPNGLVLLNLKPGETTGTPGATLAAQSTAVSDSGARVYLSLEGNLYLREGSQTKQADEDAGGGGAFEVASSDGSVAFFLKGEHLWRYTTATAHATDLTPSGGVVGVLGASADGAYLYFQDAAALRLWHSGTTTTVASGAEAAEAGDYPPRTGTSRVSTDGTKLLFASKESLTGYDNTDLAKGTPDTEVFLYDGSLRCVSCNPSGERPVGPSSIPGSVPNGASTNPYKPRLLSSNGKRVFFDSSDALALTDTDTAPDAYQWEAQGEGSCTRSGGCVTLISDGRAAGGAQLIDASADGQDAFFLTAGSLVKADPGATDLYDARVGGGFLEPEEDEICVADACQPLPSPPVDPTLTTLLTGPGNPPVRFPKERCKKGFHKHKGHCVKKGGHPKKKGGGR
jgi:hypothetical protein